MKKTITSVDVAKAAGVSQSLVSLVLNNTPNKKIKPETRELIIETASRLGYRVNINARNMKSKKANAIGLLSSGYMASFAFSPLIDGIHSVCAQNDLGLLICPDYKSPEGTYSFKEYFLQNRIDAVIYMSYVGVKRDGIIDKLISMDIPFVCIVGARDLPEVSCVDVNFVEGGYKAVSHLVDSGYKHVIHILKEKVENLNYAERERMQGCIQAAEEHNIELTMFEGFIGGYDKYSEGAENLLDLGSDFGVVATSYECYCVLKAAAHRGIRVPEQLGIISLDNEQYAPYLFPSLTTIDQPSFDMGAMGMSMLLDRMNGRLDVQKHELSPHLSIRESTEKI